MHFIINTNNNLSVGDEVAIFNESRCVGAAVYTNTNDEILIISASADDPNTEIHVGYTAGTQFHFRVWNHQSGVTIQNVNTSYISGDESFNLLGTSIHSLDGLATGTSQADENNFTITISPNPVKENAIILMNLPENGRILLAICDIYGNTFKIVSDTEFENGHQQMELKTKGLSSGYYLLKHTYTDYKQTEQGYLKFIVIK
jgi:hypothetical protein